MPFTARCGDKWSIDPCNLGEPGYRLRYYTLRFPGAVRDGCLDERHVAAACRAYLAGISWVYR